MNEWVWSDGGMILTGENLSTRRPEGRVGGEQTCSFATLYITKVIKNDQKSNPGARDDRRAANRLSHGSVLPLPQEQVNIHIAPRSKHTPSLLQKPVI
jgi:hypothetical protein